MGRLIVVGVAAAPVPVDLKMVLNAALTAANPVISGIFDAAGNRMPAMDVAARPGFVDLIDGAGRLLGIVYGNLAQIQQLAALADGVTPSNTLESTGMLYVYNGVTWDRVREGTVAGSILVDVGSPSTVLNNVRVTNAGVRLQLIVAATTIKSVTVKALTTNTGLAYVGNATVAAGNGFPLAAGETVSMDIDDLNKVYFDVAVNGEGVSYLAVA